MTREKTFQITGLLIFLFLVNYYLCSGPYSLRIASSNINHLQVTTRIFRKRVLSDFPVFLPTLGISGQCTISGNSYHLCVNTFIDETILQ